MRRVLSYSLFSLILLSGCALFRNAFKEPEVRYRDVRVENVTFSGAEIVPRFTVDNPNHVGGDIRDVEYRLYLDDILITENRLDEPISLKANGRTEVNLPIPVNFLDIYRDYQSVRGRKVPYRIEGSMKAFAFTFPIDVKGEITVPDLPDIKLTNLEISGGEIGFDLILDNRNGTALDITRFSYSIKINGNNISSGRSDIDEPIAGYAYRRVSISSTLSLKELANLGLEALEKGELKYSAEYEADFDIPGQGIETLKWKKEGELGE